MHRRPSIDPTERLDIPQMSDSRPKSVKNLNIALAHDWLVARRGGELVLDAIATDLMNDGHRINNGLDILCAQEISGIVSIEARACD